MSQQRAPIEFDKGWFADFDFAVLAARLLPDRAFVDTFRRELGQMALLRQRYPDHVLSHYWEKRERLLRELILNSGSTVESVTEAPPKRDPSAKAYCLICGAEYGNGAHWCDECEIDLVKH